jgi:hypothetical protein
MHTIFRKYEIRYSFSKTFQNDAAIRAKNPGKNIMDSTPAILLTPPLAIYEYSSPCLPHAFFHFQIKLELL